MHEENGVSWDYLGDGVYAGWNGYCIWLHANDHKNPTDKICLEPRVLEGLNRFMDRFKPVEAE